MNKTGAEVGYLSALGGKKSSTYIPQEVASPLACAEQFQFCSRAQCGILAGLNDAMDGAAQLFNITESVAKLDTFDSWHDLLEKYSSDRYATSFLWIAYIYYTYPTSAYQAISTLGPQSLESRRRLQGSFQGSYQGYLPEYQWQL
jgi:hypothetical protein